MFSMAQHSSKYTKAADTTLTLRSIPGNFYSSETRRSQWNGIHPSMQNPLILASSSKTGHGDITHPYDTLNGLPSVHGY
jgi:hypothetical protein